MYSCHRRNFLPLLALIEMFFMCAIAWYDFHLSTISSNSKILSFEKHCFQTTNIRMGHCLRMRVTEKRHDCDIDIIDVRGNKLILYEYSFPWKLYYKIASFFRKLMPYTAIQSCRKISVYHSYQSQTLTTNWQTYVFCKSGLLCRAPASWIIKSFCNINFDEKDITEELICLLCHPWHKTHRCN